MTEKKETFTDSINQIRKLCDVIQNKIVALDDADFQKIKQQLQCDICEIENVIVRFGKPICETFDCIKKQCDVAPNIVLDYQKVIQKLCKELNVISRNVEYHNIRELNTRCQCLTPLVEHLVEDVENFKANMILMGLSLINDLPLKVRSMESTVSNLEERIVALDSNIFKAGLAESFKEREKELCEPKERWFYSLIVFIAFIPISLALIEWVYPFNSDDIIISMSIRTPIFVSLFWLAWFSSKKYTYISNIQDDYRYKYALAMAYQGYSSEVMKLRNHDKLLALLLGSLIENISQNPLDHVQSEPHTPWAETISPIVEKMGKDS